MARNSCLNTSMRVKCVICCSCRGAEFPRASARPCLTFPHSVYSAHRFSSRSFFLSDPMYGIRRAANATALSWGTADTALISLHGQCDPISHCTATNSWFHWTLQYIFVYTAGPSTFEFGLWPQVCRFSHKVAPDINFSHFIELWNEIFQSQLLPPRRKHGSLAWESGPID